MRFVKSLTALIGAFVVTGLLPSSASAQLGGVLTSMNYPKNDFKWYWGRQSEVESRRGAPDFDVDGFDGGFRCSLTGRMSVSSPMSISEIREFEEQLRGGSFFIQTAANAMYTLDLQRQIRWAELDCVKPEDNATDAELREREDKARAKAERARERRRAREDRDDPRGNF